MYDRRKWYSMLVEQIKVQDADNVLKDKHVLLLQVELGLRLIERLALSDEPITILWVLLSDNPIPDARLQALSVQQRHEIANARILLPFAGRFNWENALRDYAMIKEQWRCYRVYLDDLDTQQVCNLKSYQERLVIYDETLESILPFAQRNITPAKEGIYIFDAITADGQKRGVTIEIDEDSANMATTSIDWFPQPPQPRQRKPLKYSHDDFRNIAHDIEHLRQQRNLKKALGSQRSWENLVEDVLGYCAILPDGSLAARNTIPLRIEGLAYVVGAVAAGKSTIAKLILADAALHPEKDLRVTLVVTDTMSALNLADEINTLFCKPGEQPVAVPLIGRSTRDQHLERLHRSSKFRSDHWALRWLNPACPLQALAINPEPCCTRPGQEPCESLYLPEEQEKRKKYHFCPLFAVCPSKRQYRDMSGACVWITTPGALGKATIPAQIEQRKVHLTEIIYEQSDLVIFDEADTVQEWFDNLFAEEVVLTNGNNGLLDVEDVEMAQEWVPRRTQPPPTRRWVNAERHSLASISGILSNLADRQQGSILRHWVGRNYFTALTLAYKLAWRLLGLAKREECQGQELIEADKKVQPIVSYFDKLNEKDPLTIERPRDNAQLDPVYRLALIMRTLLAAGDSTHNSAASQECQAWILDFVPNIQQTLQKLQEKLVAWQKQPKKDKDSDEEVPDLPDSLETLALRLEFVLNVMILDRNIRVVFYEWYNKPYAIQTDLNEHSLKGAPSNLTDVLPIPPTGRVFGTYYSKGLEIGQNDQKKHELPSGLSVFGYSNIGRWYTVHFHELFSALDGSPGPNVLALSGTSWLPHSSRWHIDVAPQGILNPPKDAQKAIEGSKFFYIPQSKIGKKKKLEPIVISGKPNKLQPIKDLVRALASDRNGQKSPLREELANLQRLGQQNPDYWADRERLLLIVNSYDQAEWAYQELRSSEALLGEIRYLKQSNNNDQNEDDVVGTTLYRSDIEDFARTKGKILIAPMQAIGRGYNILNQHGKAAFGAIYFLTRPMPYPADTQALARELNRRTLDWCKDSSLSIWQKQRLYEKATALREKASMYWRRAELRSYYHTLKHEDERHDTTYSERFDLAATTAGHIIQACGRLLRGGVPFHTFFADAAWAPRTAEDNTITETSQSSLLTAMVEVMQQYTQNSLIGHALYAPIVYALNDIDGFEPEY